MSLEKGILRLKRQREEAEKLLQTERLEDEAVNPWCATTRAALIDALGEKSAEHYLSLVSHASWQTHGYNVFEDEEEAKEDVRKGLRGAITVLNSCIEQLESSLPPSDSQKELEQKFKILHSASQAQRDFDEWKHELEPKGYSIAVLFVDIDHFKTLNSRHTETVVDRTILPDAQRLLGSLVNNRGDAYRQGGEEFVAVLPNHEIPESSAFAERIRRTFEGHVFKVGESTERLTVSIGFAMWPAHGSTYQEVLLRANEAMRLAKQHRNMVKLAPASLAENTPLRTTGLSVNAQRLAALLNERSQTGQEHDPILEPNAILESLHITEEELAVAADELQDRGWAHLSLTSGMGKAGFSDMWPTPTLFIEIDPLLKGWNPKDDAKLVARTVSDSDENQLYSSEIDARLSWGPRRLNPAIDYLVLNEIVKPSEACGAHPYTVMSLFGSARTKRFASES